MNPYVFIVGCPRSGTTLLRRIVDAHPEIAITPETHWLPTMLEERIGVDGEGRVTPALIPALLEHPKFARLAIDEPDLTELIGSRRPHYRDFVSALFDLYGARHGKRLVGDKTPRYVRAIATLHALWPGARIVHLVRDGRDVCLSAVSWTRKQDEFVALYRTWRDDPVTTAAYWWAWNVTLGRAAAAHLPDDLYLELRYEDLVHDPNETCRRLCAFLGLWYDERMLRFHEGRTRVKPGRSAKRAWLPLSAGLRDWKTHMAARDLERFEVAAGALLDELGYERGAPSLSGSAIANARRVGRVFAQDVAGQTVRAA
jgi:Sulfotransferase family